MRHLRDKRALVTGAGSGIGRAIALALAREGTHLVLADRTVELLPGVLDEVRKLGVTATAIGCDVRDVEATSRLCRQVLADGGVDILVNNAGVAVYGPTEAMTAEHWDRVLRVNLLAPIQIVRELLPSLLERREAHIVNIGSLAGLVAGPKLAAYNVSKFGLQGLSETLRAEYGATGLGVTAVCPGFATTNIYAAANDAGCPETIVPPPAWLRTSAEHIAARTLRGIRRNSPIVVVTLHARLLWFLKRLVPRIFLRFFRGSSGKRPNPSPPATTSQ